MISVKVLFFFCFVRTLLTTSSIAFVKKPFKTTEIAQHLQQFGLYQHGSGHLQEASEVEVAASALVILQAQERGWLAERVFWLNLL